MILVESKPALVLIQQGLALRHVSALTVCRNGNLIWCDSTELESLPSCEHATLLMYLKT